MITFDNVSKVYPDGTVAVDKLTLTAPNGKITTLVGPSGCGKTTSMRMINRLIDPSSGTIELDGVDTQTLDRVALRRRIGYVIRSRDRNQPVRYCEEMARRRRHQRTISNTG
jgi:osmoprotectant transport system ATP-binding protein